MLASRLARVLVADPPWSFNDKLPVDTRGADKQYPCLTLSDIMRFPLPDLAPDAILFLWRVSSQVEEAYQVVRAWGFVPKTEIVWVKTGESGEFTCPECGSHLFGSSGCTGPFSEMMGHCHGRIQATDGSARGCKFTWRRLDDFHVFDTKLHFGMGHYTRAAHETCIVATRGKFKVADRGVRSVFLAPLGEHSEKPAAFFGLVETLCGAKGEQNGEEDGGPFVELFARAQRPGWHTFGNEIVGGYVWTPKTTASHASPTGLKEALVVVGSTVGEPLAAKAILPNGKATNGENTYDSSKSGIVFPPGVDPAHVTAQQVADALNAKGVVSNGQTFNVSIDGGPTHGGYRVEVDGAIHVTSTVVGGHPREAVDRALAKWELAIRASREATENEEENADLEAPVPGPVPETPAKRKPGRPKGSKNGAAKAPPADSGELPAHVIPELGKHPVIVSEVQRLEYLARAVTQGLLAKDDVENPEDGWIKLQYRAPVGFFAKDPPEAENLGILHAALHKRGAPLTLVELAGFTPIRRDVLKAWAEQGGEQPDWLIEHFQSQCHKGRSIGVSAANVLGGGPNGWDLAIAVAKAHVEDATP